MEGTGKSGVADKNRQRVQKQARVIAVVCHRVTESHSHSQTVGCGNTVLWSLVDGGCATERYVSSEITADIRLRQNEVTRRKKATMYLEF